MHVLIVLCHPNPASYTAALAGAAVSGAQAAGHAVRLIDLYAEGFDPVLGADDHAGYGAPTTGPDLLRHAADLSWADRLVIVAPVWWSGPPAMLKGWLDRVWRPGLAFTTGPRGTLRPGLPNIRRLEVVTTLGMPRLLWWLTGQPGRRMLLRCLRPCIAATARTRWHALYRIDASTPATRAAFLARIRAAFARP